MVSEFLQDMVARDFSASSVRSYAQALLRWMRYLWSAGLAWDRADRGTVRDFVLWMRQASPGRPGRKDGRRPGSRNAMTGKRYLAEQFAPATINHNLAVVSAFYLHHIEAGRGPLRNPVPARRGLGGRPDAHHNPLEPFAPRRLYPRTRRRAAR